MLRNTYWNELLKCTVCLCVFVFFVVMVLVAVLVSIVELSFFYDIPKV